MLRWRSAASSLPITTAWCRPPWPRGEHHSGVNALSWIALVISILAALAGAAAAWFARSQARAAKDQALAAKDQVEIARQQAILSSDDLALAKLIRQDQSQPFVFVDIAPDESGFLLMIVVENAGPTIARNIRIRFDPPLRSATFKEVQNLQFPQDVIAALAPGRRIRWYLDTGPAIFGGNVPTSYGVTVNADGPFGPIDQLAYRIDLAILAGSEGRAQGRLKDLIDETRKSASALKDIRRELMSLNEATRSIIETRPPMDPPHPAAPDASKPSYGFEAEIPMETPARPQAQQTDPAGRTGSD